jgi:hypothetical protein
MKMGMRATFSSIFFLRQRAKWEAGIDCKKLLWAKTPVARRDTTPTHCPSALLRIFILSIDFVNIF